MEIKTCFKDENEKREFVDLCEREFSESVKSCAKSLAETEDLKFITLSGPTCSGKTTAAELLVDAMNVCGKSVGVISIDDFYLERRVLDSRGKLDYDSVDTIDLELLKKVIDGIEDGETVEIPIYSFKSGERTGYRKYDGSKGITLFEGIQAIYPEIRRLFDKDDVKSVYISVGRDVCVNGTQVSSRTIRLFRRLVRDFERRATTPEFTLKLWESVAANEDSSIFPYENETDFKIDSLMGYEISIIKEPLMKLLDMLGSNSAHYEFAQNIKKIFDGAEPLSKAYLPENSLYREFI